MPMLLRIPAIALVLIFLSACTLMESPGPSGSAGSTAGESAAPTAEASPTAPPSSTPEPAVEVPLAELDANILIKFTNRDAIIHSKEHWEAIGGEDDTQRFDPGEDWEDVEGGVRSAKQMPPGPVVSWPSTPWRAPRRPRVPRRASSARRPRCRKCFARSDDFLAPA